MARLRTEGKRDDILAAAGRVFARRAFHEVLIDDVAAEAGVGKGTIYRYFESKDALYLTVIHRGFAQLTAAIQARCATACDPEERLLFAAREIVSMFSGKLEIFELMARNEARLRPAQGLIRKEREKLLQHLVSILRGGVEHGRFRDLEVRRAAEMFLGLARAINLSRRPGDDVESLAGDLVSVFLDGIRRRSSTT